MATNTNYTTKTAALKATKADMRQVQVSKKLTSKEVWIDDAEGVSTNVLELIGDAQEAATTAASGALSAAKTELEGKIKQAADNAAIQVGRDADKNWSVDETAIDMVKKISFLGDYVNVVPGENGEVKLYIGENKSLEEADRSALSVTLPTTESVVLYTDSTDNFALKSGATANGSATDVVVKTADAGFGSTKFTANGGSFTTDQTDCIWVRTTYNYGTPSAWGKVQLNTNRGTYRRNTTTPTSSYVDVAEVKDVTLPTGVSMNVGNYILTAEADAQYGKVPGRCETAYDFTVNWNTIATLGGGNIKVEWGLGSANEAGDAPSSAVAIKSYERFFTEKKDVSMDSTNTNVAIATAKLSDAVSGLKYNTAGTTVTVTSGVISNSQYKSSNKDKTRLVVDAAGTSTTYTTDSTALTVVGDKTTSAATYQLKDATLTLGSTGNGSATVTLTPYGYAKGTAQSKTIPTFWGSIPTSSATVENFGKESGTGGYRMKTPTSTSVDFVSTEDVTTHSIDVNGTTCCSAVCQYGKLYHPSSTSLVADAEGKTYSSDKPACFIRTFTGSKPNTFKLEGINLIQSGKVQVWWKDGGNWYDLSTPVTGSVAHTNAGDDKSDTITKTILTADGETSRPDMLIAIVVQPGAKYIGPITATFA
jgi:hypothetical protein